MHDDADLTDAQPPGSRVGPVVLVEARDQGGEGILYAARHDSLGDVFVKEYWPRHIVSRATAQAAKPAKSAWQEDYRRGVQKFVALGQRLIDLPRHPNIVRAHEIAEANQTAYLVMEQVDGRTVEDALEAEALSDPAVVAELARQLAAALRFIHEHHLVHRDISPDNVMITAGHDWRAVLIDFSAGKDLIVRHSHSYASVIKDGYSPMELYTQDGSQKMGPWTDIYGASAVLYHCITGKRPRSAAERALGAVHADLTQTRPEGYPPGLLAQIDRGLMLQPGDRPQSVDEWVAPGVDSAPTSPPLPPPPPPPPSHRGSPRLYRVLAFGLLAVAMIAVVLFALPSPTYTTPEYLNSDAAADALADQPTGPPNDRVQPTADRFASSAAESAGKACRVETVTKEKCSLVSVTKYREQSDRQRVTKNITATVDYLGLPAHERTGTCWREGSGGCMANSIRGVTPGKSKLASQCATGELAEIKWSCIEISQSPCTERMTLRATCTMSEDVVAKVPYVVSEQKCAPVTERREICT